MVLVSTNISVIITNYNFRYIPIYYSNGYFWANTIIWYHLKYGKRYVEQRIICMHIHNTKGELNYYGLQPKPEFKTSH